MAQLVKKQILSALGPETLEHGPVKTGFQTVGPEPPAHALDIPAVQEASCTGDILFSGGPVASPIEHAPSELVEEVHAVHAKQIPAAGKLLQKAQEVCLIGQVVGTENTHPVHILILQQGQGGIPFVAQRRIGSLRIQKAVFFGNGPADIALGPRHGRDKLKLIGQLFLQESDMRKHHVRQFGTLPHGRYISDPGLGHVRSPVEEP